MQLGHSGRKGSTQLGWERMDYPLERGNWPVVSASPIPYYEGVSQIPLELDSAGMKKIIGDFEKSARYADEAGFGPGAVAQPVCRPPSGPGSASIRESGVGSSGYTGLPV